METPLCVALPTTQSLQEFMRTELPRLGHEVTVCPDGKTAMKVLEKSTFDAAILDLRMPGMSGLELQEHLIAESIPMPIAFITGHGDVSMAVTTMKKGAVDFIEKPFKENELKLLVEKMLTRARLDYAKADNQKNTQNLLSKLTGREKQVLERIVAGRLNKQIADDLNISIKTVEAHRANIMEKLNVNTVADLLRLALSDNNN